MEEKLGSSSATATTTANRSTKVCVYYNTPRGCTYGERCRYRHVLNNDGHSTRAQQQQQHKQHKQHKHEQQRKSSKNTRSNQTYRSGERQQRDGTISNERVKVSGGSLEEGDERRDAVLHCEDNRFSASTSHRSTTKPHQSLVQSSSLSSTRSLERIKGGGITEEDCEDGEISHLHSLLQFPQIGSQSTNQYHHYQQHHVSQDGRNSSFGRTVPSTSDTRQYEAGKSRSRGNNTTRTQPRRGPSSEFSLGDLLVRSTTGTTRQPVARPTTEKSDDLFSTEIQQMKLRFSDNNLELLEKSSVQHVYKIMFEPTDPDWPFSFGVLVLKVTFPASYPKELCTVVLAEDGEKILPQHCTKSINDAVSEELKKLSQSLGKSALIFRPFLRWFDRNIVELIRMSCSPKDLESLLPVRKTQPGNFSSDGKCPDDDDGRNSFDESDDDESDGDHHSNDHHDNSNEAQLVSTCEGTVKRGTEVKVKNLTLTPEVGVVQCTEMKVVLLCGRCKESVDVRVKPLKVVNSTCPRCHLSISVHYRPSTVHLENTTMGFLDVDSCIVYDVVMFGSEVTVSCMTCGKNTCTKGLHYGQPHLLWCQHCHQKMIVTMETCRLMQHAPLDHPAQMPRSSESSQVREKRSKEVEIREGHPLPGRGTCEHYKKSFRWLRFPCCGKAFPCDVCHDTKEDHLYELANRMICGHCAKEQAYTSGKPCMACKSLLTSTASTGFWEGGQGCRNKLKMNRNEKKKYSNSTSKTSSLKKERVGVKGKMKALHV